MIEENEDTPYGLDTKFLSTEDLLDLKLKRAEIQLAELRRTCSQLESVVLQYKLNDVLREKQAKEQELLEEAKSRKARLEGYGNELGQKYEVDFNNIVLDDETGLITQL